MWSRDTSYTQSSSVLGGLGGDVSMDELGGERD